MDNLELKRLVISDAKVKIAEDGTGTFSGYGSVFGNVDAANERVVAGAFANCIDRFIKDGWIAISHEWGDLPIATVDSAIEDEFGLFITGTFHSTPAAQEARTVCIERLARGKTVGLSIGYFVVKSTPNNGVLDLLELDLREVSIVNAPCNRMAGIVEAKAEGSVVPQTQLFAEECDAALGAVHGVQLRAEAINSIREKGLGDGSAELVNSLISRVEDLLDALKLIVGVTDEPEDPELDGCRPTRKDELDNEVEETIPVVEPQQETIQETPSDSKNHTEAGSTCRSEEHTKNQEYLQSLAVKYAAYIQEG